MHWRRFNMHGKNCGAIGKKGSTGRMHDLYVHIYVWHGSVSMIIENIHVQYIIIYIYEYEYMTRWKKKWDKIEFHIFNFAYPPNVPFFCLCQKVEPCIRGRKITRKVLFFPQTSWLLVLPILVLFPMEAMPSTCRSRLGAAILFFCDQIDPSLLLDRR